MDELVWQRWGWGAVIILIEVRQLGQAGGHFVRGEAIGFGDLGGLGGLG